MCLLYAAKHSLGDDINLIVLLGLVVKQVIE